jgi:hypothetical protein
LLHADDKRLNDSFIIIDDNNIFMLADTDPSNNKYESFQLSEVVMPGVSADPEVEISILREPGSD